MTIEETKRKLVEDYTLRNGKDINLNWFCMSLDSLEAVVRIEALNTLPPERIIHAYMESQNTGENRGWNDYRNAAIKALLPSKDQ